MNYIIKLFILFTLTNMHAQSDKRNYDYLFETFTIAEESIFELLLNYRNNFDSIQYLTIHQSFRNPKKSYGYGGSTIYPIDSLKIDKKIIELQNRQPKGDTIIFSHRETVIYTIYPHTQNNFHFPDEYNIRMTRNQKRVKFIKTKNVKAKFKYDSFNRLTRIKFNYTIDEKKSFGSFEEGTLAQINFEYHNGVLFYVDFKGFYGSNVDIVKYF